ncbi:glycosyltransferase family 2 protein [Actinoplanes sp. NPDC051859]|uniref:glycosyltransferase family 2 protein n=1 Tax=Actinoplanes sp. NPDC051859 TaxID=3363909 RepID=UPI00379B141C
MTEVAFLSGVTRPELLAGLHASLCAQDVDWKWCAQLDGDAIGWEPGEADRDGWLGDPRVELERNPKPLGSGTSRNLALIRSKGTPYVLCVDDDDLLYPGGIDTLLKTVKEQRKCLGAWGRTDVMRDATEPPDAATAEVFKSWPETGLIPPGTIGAQFQETGRFAVHVGAVLWRRTHLVAVGGYGALPRSIDTHPFISAESLFPVYYEDVPVYRYLIHPGQMTQTAYYQEIKSRVQGHTFERAALMRQLLELREE